MTYPQLDYRFRPRRTAYQNFVSYLEYLNRVQGENQRKRRCIVRLIRVRGHDGESTAKDLWKTYCENKLFHIGGSQEALAWSNVSPA